MSWSNKLKNTSQNSGPQPYTKTPGYPFDMFGLGPENMSFNGKKDRDAKIAAGHNSTGLKVDPVSAVVRSAPR
jgi:hypothetical protein